MRERLSGMAFRKAGLKRKLLISFCLMSIMPLLTFCFMIFYYARPGPYSLWISSIVFLLVLLLALIGYHLMREIFAQIIRITSAVKDLPVHAELKDISITSEDEIGVLEAAINRLVRRLSEEREADDSTRSPPEAGRP